MDDAWKELDQVTRKWAVMSGFENDLKNYENLKENQDDSENKEKRIQYLRDYYNKHVYI
jgi:hypothetical protein